MKEKNNDVVIIGAGPSGSVAACLLRQYGYSVSVFEKSQFPRFVIGESLLPHSLQTLEKAGCLDAVTEFGFQNKAGALFKKNGTYRKIFFDDKFSSGPGEAFHVKRADFDQILTDCATEQGADIYFQHEVTSIEAQYNNCRLRVIDNKGVNKEVRSRFILDASGYGRLLPRLLNIDIPSSMPARASLFTHMIDNSTLPRDYTLINIHPTNPKVWFWVIPFADGTSSIGAVGDKDYLKPYQNEGIKGLQRLIQEDIELNSLLVNAEYPNDCTVINGYSGSVSDYFGDGFAILGNAGEFLDPIFSSGVASAVYSSQLATQSLHQQLQGKTIDWHQDYEVPLKKGIDVFRQYINAWYDQSLQNIIFSEQKNQNITEMIASILAGYAWDENNPLIAHPNRLNALAKLCQD